MSAPAHSVDLLSVSHLVRAERIRMLYAGLPLSQSVALVNGIVLAAVQAMVIERIHVFFWLFCLASVTAARFAAGSLFERASLAERSSARWLRLFRAGAVVAGIVWGSAAWLLYPPDSVEHQVFLAFVLGGMVAGALSLLASVYHVYALFAACALGPAILRFLWSGDYMHHAMAGMGSLFLLVMLASGKRVHDTIFQSLTLRFENRALVADLTDARRHLEAANADLLATQQTLRTSNEQLERRVAERTEALESADRHKNEFLAMLSHELRNPLAAITASSHVLQHEGASLAQSVRARQVIDRQASYLSRLVDDLLAVAQIVAGKMVMHREPADLVECLRRTVDDHAALFEELGVRLLPELPQGPLWATVDPMRIAQLIGNLLQNAAKFTPAGGQVTLSLRVDGEWAEIRVRDSGAGIDPGVLPRLFEPFAQGARGVRLQRGLGLGLALARRIAELHGGTVRGDDNGREPGATFTVRLPLAPAASGAQRDRPAAANDPLAPNRSVLVVDDNRDAADSLALLVETLGHSTQVAYDGPSAIAQAKQATPDIVLCDLGLPGMTGFEVARTLRSELKGIRLVAVTGYTGAQDAAEAAAAGFDGYLTKPPELEALRAWLS
ncbi:MAG TPA: hybrid sensor histidine kinase/response regulator [Burkholderiales bacterium]|nr:hybrid sensor histidine kinase/response regulator [Burkholderiales bacterium]